MKLSEKFISLIVVILVLGVSWKHSVDARAVMAINSGLDRALVTFASARALSGIVAVVQESQLDIEPAGIGVTLAPGQVLEPLRELLDHFSDLMLLACVSFVIQKVLVAIGSHWVVSAVLTALAFVWSVYRFRGNRVPKILSNTLIVVFLLRFGVAGALLCTEAVSKQFLEGGYRNSQAAISTLNEEGVGDRRPLNVDDKCHGKWICAWFDKHQGADGDPNDLRGKISKTQALENNVNAIIDLIAVFFLQTLLFPLVFLGMFVKILSSTFKRSGNGPPPLAHKSD